MCSTPSPGRDQFAKSWFRKATYVHGFCCSAQGGDARPEISTDKYMRATKSKTLPSAWEGWSSPQVNWCQITQLEKKVTRRHENNTGQPGFGERPSSAQTSHLSIAVWLWVFNMKSVSTLISSFKWLEAFLRFLWGSNTNFINGLLNSKSR